MEGKNMRIKYTMFMLAAMLAACTNEPLPETIVEEAPVSYTLVVTATKGDDDTTKALSLDEKTLNATWAQGETVSVYSVTGEGYSEMESSNPVGTLTAQGSGATTTLKGKFLEGYTPMVNAKLRLKFNDKPDYTTQEGTLEYIAANCDYATADVTISDVTESNVSTTAATFDNQQAVVKFALKKQDGTALNVTSLTVKYATSTYDVTLGSPASDIFVAIPQKSNKTVTLTATSADGDFKYEKTGITFENGKYYAIGVKMAKTPAALGNLFYSDGVYSNTLIPGKTPIGVIAYLGTDVFSENGATLRDGATTLQSHGLVLCLRNIANVKWRKAQSEGGPAYVIDFPAEAIVDDTGDLTRTTNVSGYANTKFLAEKTDAESNYPAAYQTWNYSTLTAPATTTGWFMPSMQQWVKMLTALGGMSEADIVWKAWKDTDLTSIHTLETVMEKAGDKGAAYDGMSDSNRYYWSSSESNATAATTISVWPTISGGQQGLFITGSNKVNYWNYYVRPVLAF